MNTVIITIKTNRTALQEGYCKEIARILRSVAQTFEQSGTCAPSRDTLGDNLVTVTLASPDVLARKGGAS